MLRADVNLPAPPTHLGFQRNKRAAPRGSPLLGEACGPSSGSVLTAAEGRGRIERDPWLRGRKPSAPPEGCQAGRAGPVSCLGVMAVDANYDVVVVGGGAAGLSAALVLGRARRRVAVVDAATPRNAPAAHMHGYLSRDGLPPVELLALGRAEVAGYGVELLQGEVCSIQAGFVVGFGDGRSLRARRLLVATGLSDVLPEIPGVREQWGKDLLHCPYCHGWEVRDQPLGVLGTSSAAVQHALLVRQWSPDVIFFTHAFEPTATERRQLASRGIRIVDGPVARLVVAAGRLHGVELADGTVFPRVAVFVRPALAARGNDLLAQVGCVPGEDGFVPVDATGQTSAAGVWAAGNVVDPRAQVITAGGAGSAAAIALNTDLIHEDVTRALERYQPAGAVVLPAPRAAGPAFQPVPPA